MPVLPALALGASVLQGIANPIIQAKQNKKQQQFAIDMYNKQRQDALTDWNAQNLYNSPAEQMRRLRDAKLNPNLVYGNGSATQESGPVRNTDMDAWRPSTPQLDVTPVQNSLMSMYDIELKEAQVNNLETLNTNMGIDGLLKLAQIDSTKVGTAKSQFELDMQSELRAISLDMQRETLRKLRIDSQVTLNKDEREAAANASNLAEAVERIATMRVGRPLTEMQKRSIEKDVQLKQSDLQLRKEGIFPGSPWWLKLVGTWVDKIVNSFNQRGSGIHGRPQKPGKDQNKYDSLLKTWSEPK